MGGIVYKMMSDKRCLKLSEIAIAVVVLCLACAGISYSGKVDRQMYVLTIGNSFSQNTCHYLADLAKAGGHKLFLGHADYPGCSLEHHIAILNAAEKDPNDPNGRPYGISWPVIPGEDVGHKNLKEVLMLKKWDIVTIQQSSPITTNYSTYQPYGRELYDYIKKYAPQAEVVVHETWPFRCDDPRFADGKDSQAKMYSELHSAYNKLASDLGGLRIIPVGDAFNIANTNPVWGYKPPQNKDVVYPNLPDQTNSLNAGWYWAKNSDGGYKLQLDAHHASNLGCYLAGCVWYEFLFNDNVVGNSYIPSEITHSSAGFLQKVADEAVQNVKKK